VQCAGSKACRIFGLYVIDIKWPLLVGAGELNTQELFTRRCLSSGSVTNAVRAGNEGARTHVQKQEPYYGKMSTKVLSTKKHSSQS
jgi:hypothetical protein